MSTQLDHAQRIYFPFFCLQAFIPTVCNSKNEQVHLEITSTVMRLATSLSWGKKKYQPPNCHCYPLILGSLLETYELGFYVSLLRTTKIPSTMFKTISSHLLQLQLHAQCLRKSSFIFFNETQSCCEELGRGASANHICFPWAFCCPNLGITHSLLVVISPLLDSLSFSKRKKVRIPRDAILSYYLSRILPCAS